MALIETRIDEGKVVTRDKVAIAIEQFRAYEQFALNNNPEGYYLAFSGGKDSQCIYHLALEAGVKFKAYFSPTTVDPPQLLRFIRRQYPDVIWNKKTTSMWALITKKKVPPTRLMRYCCQELKERGGAGRFIVTGVRWAESVNRKAKRGLLEVQGSKPSENLILNSDNSENRRMFETCRLQGKQILNPIVGWTDEDAWEYLNGRNIPHCELYDMGLKRIGCIGCPMSVNGLHEMETLFPEYKQAYINTYTKMIAARNEAGLTTQWKTGDDVLRWIYSTASEKPIEGQETIEDYFL